MLIGMFGIAVMAAAAPDVAHVLEATGDTHDGWFIAAYITCRVGASQTLQRSGTILTAWPAAQLGAGLIPWFASIGVHGPGRYLLWGLGAGLDLIFSVLQSRRPERLINELQRQAQRQAQRLEDRDRRRGNGAVLRPAAAVKAAVLDPAHLGERLGLFVIIVLGEAVMQVVMASSGHSWDLQLGLAAVAGFGLIVSLWWLTLQYGVSAVPGAAERGLRAYVALPAHFAMTAGITATAAGLGAVAADPAAHPHGGVGWVLGAGLAVYFAASAVLGVAGGRRAAVDLGMGAAVRGRAAGGGRGVRIDRGLGRGRVAAGRRPVAGGLPARRRHGPGGLSPAGVARRPPCAARPVRRGSAGCARWCPPARLAPRRSPRPWR
jgi:hypothetical protein